MEVAQIFIYFLHFRLQSLVFAFFILKFLLRKFNCVFLQSQLQLQRVHILTDGFIFAIQNSNFLKIVVRVGGV